MANSVTTTKIPFPVISTKL